MPWLVRKKLESQFPALLALASRAKPEAGLPRTPLPVKKWSDPDEGYNFENLSHSGRVWFSARRKNAIVGLGQMTSMLSDLLASGSEWRRPRCLCRIQTRCHIRFMDSHPGAAGDLALADHAVVALRR
jgi:hypothetical protein